MPDRPSPPRTRTGAAALLAGLLLALGCGSGGEAGGAGQASSDAGSAAPRGSAQEVGREAPDTAAARGETGPKTTIHVAGIPVAVEIADDEAERNRGLMHRDSLPEDHGMLFVYPEEGERSFWMRNTRIPLDIAFLDRQGTIVDIQTMEPESDELHTSRRPAMYALEMIRGWFGEHGVEIGDRVRF